MQIEEFYLESNRLVEKFNSFVDRNKLQDYTLADHICYKCGDSKTFESIRKILENESAFIYQSIISKRRISIIKFKNGIETALGPIFYLELSDQKPDGSQLSGFDHIEIYPKGISYEELIKRLENSGEKLVKVERPHHTTYDIVLEGNLSVKLSQEPLINKIKREEMI